MLGVSTWKTVGDVYDIALRGRYFELRRFALYVKVEGGKARRFLLRWTEKREG